MPFDPLLGAGGRPNWNTGERVDHQKLMHGTDLANQSLFNGFLARAMQDDADNTVFQGAFGDDFLTTWTSGTDISVAPGWGLLRIAALDLTNPGDEFDLQYAPVVVPAALTATLTPIVGASQRYDAISLQVVYVDDLSQSVAIKVTPSSSPVATPVDERSKFAVNLVVTEGVLAPAGTAVKPTPPADQLLVSYVLVSDTASADPVPEDVREILQFGVTSHDRLSATTIEEGLGLTVSGASMDITLESGIYSHKGILRRFLAKSTTLTVPANGFRIYAVDVDYDGNILATPAYTDATPGATASFYDISASISAPDPEEPRFHLVEVRAGDTGLSSVRVHTVSNTGVISPAQVRNPDFHGRGVPTNINSDQTNMSILAVDREGNAIAETVAFRIRLRGPSYGDPIATDIFNPVAVAGTFVALPTAKQEAIVQTNAAGLMTLTIERTPIGGLQNYYLDIEPIVMPGNSTPHFESKHYPGAMAIVPFTLGP